jgi:hypothetical protein
MKSPKSQPFSAEQLQSYIAAYAMLPELVRRDCGAEFRTDPEQRLFILRQVMVSAIAEWLGYLLQLRAEPPHKLAHERGLKAYAETDRAWLDLITETRLRSDAQWMQNFGSALHLWFASQFEAEYKALCRWGLLQSGSGTLPSKRAWAISQREEFKALLGESSQFPISFVAAPATTLSEALSGTILSIAERDIQFREKYLRPYLKKQSWSVFEVRDCTHMQSICLDGKGRIALASGKPRGFKIGDCKVL